MSIKNTSLEIKKGSIMQCTECPVRQRALFQGVPLEDLEWTQHFRDTQYQLGAKKVLYTETQAHPFAYTLFSGWVALSKSLANGKRQILRIALPGDFLGFQSDQTGVMSHSAHTLTASTFCAFPRGNLQEMFEQRPEISHRIATMNARDMLICQEHLLGTGQKSSKERIAFLLLEMYHRVKSLKNLVPNTTENSIHFPLSQEQIADVVGLTTVHVNRTLGELRRENLLELASKKLTIYDEEKLAHIAQFSKAMVLEAHML